MDADTTGARIVRSVNCMVLLQSACRALLQVEVRAADSDWYPLLDEQLGEVRHAVAGWCRSGTAYAGTEILQTVLVVARVVQAARAAIDELFDAAGGPGSAPPARLVGDLTAVQTAVTRIAAATGSHLDGLAAFRSSLDGPCERLRRTVADVQARETRVRAEIDTINGHVRDLQTSIADDRAAIARAERARTSGIIETIFGVLLGSATGGSSLVLAGIGAASISEAEGMIESMRSAITVYQAKIVAAQAELSTEERAAATLGALSMSAQVVVDDIGVLDTSLVTLRTQWTQVADEIAGAVHDIRNAATPQEIVVRKAWFDAFAREWALVADQVSTLTDRPTTTDTVAVG